MGLQQKPQETSNRKVSACHYDTRDGTSGQRSYVAGDVCLFAAVYLVWSALK